MTNISKFIALILLGLSLSYCAKKEETPAPDYVGEWVGNYSSFSGSASSVKLEKVSGTEAKVSFTNGGTTYSLNLTYQNAVDGSTSGYTTKTSYFNAPITSSTGFNAYGQDFDLNSTETGVQNASIAKTSISIAGFSSSSTSLTVYAKLNNGTNVTIIGTK